MDIHKLQVVLEANIKEFKKKMAEAKEDVREATKEIKKEVDLTKQAFNDVGGFKALKKAVKDTFSPLTALFKPRQSKALEPLIEEVRQAEKEYERLLAIQKSIPATIKDPRGGKRVNPAYLDAKAQTSAQEEILAQARANYAAKSSELASAAYEKERSKLSKLAGALRKVINLFRKGTKFNGDFSRGMRSTYGTGGMLSRMFRTIAISGRFMIASMIWRGAFNTVTEGFKDLYNSGGKTAQSMVQLRNALYGLRGSFATAFAPILNFVTPALITLINTLNAAMNAIARFFAVLTGQKTYEVATAGVSGFGDAAGGASDKAKELQKTILGFDKINKLDDNSGSGGGGGGGGGTNAMFNTLENASSKFADMVKKAWANDADFTDIGKFIGEKLSKALDSINWEPIKAKAYKIGKAIATLLNGFNEPSTWKSIGRTLGEGINTAFSFLYGFVSNFDFKKFGKALAAGLNKAVQTVDWKLIGKTIGEAIKGLASWLAELVTNIDWGQVAEAIRVALSEAVRGAVAALPDLIKSAGGILAGILSIGIGIAEGLFQGILMGLGDISGWLKKNLVDPIINSVKKFFGIASPPKVMASIGVDIIKGLLQGIKNTWDTIVQFFKDKIKGIKDTITNAWNNIKTATSTAWNNIKTAITTPISNAISTAKSKLSTLVSTFKEKFDSIKSKVDSLKSKLTSFFNIKWKLKLPKISLKTKTATLLGKTITYPTGFDISYAKGGFPEEGPFFMNRGEIAGKFSNGKGVVANNQQITTGIANAVGPAVYDAMVSALGRMGGTGGRFEIVPDPQGIFKVVQTEANNYMQATGQPAFNF